jgi:hypothetical protein
MNAARRALSRSACLRLLSSGGQGRVAATSRAVPVIILVNFTLVGEDLVFRPTSGAGLAPALSDAVVAFETDELGSDRQVVWDVHVTGVAQLVTDGASSGPTGAPAFCLSSAVMIGWQAVSSEAH